MPVPKIAEIPEPQDLSEAIRKISDAMDRLLKSGLKRDAIVVLLRDSTGISKRDINAVMDGLKDLARQYTVEKK